jgi:hypothetical protein
MRSFGGGSFFITDFTARGAGHVAFAPRFPGMLAAVAFGAGAVWLFNLPVETIGTRFGGIPGSLPMPSLPHIDAARALEVFPAAIAIALLGGMESLLSAVVADGMTGRRHRSNCELVAQGYANIASALFGGLCVTGTIARFTPNGVEMQDGTHVPADMIVLATGFNLCVFGDIAFSIDGKPLDMGDTVTWRGMMFTGVPNLVWVFGYFRASWTLRSDMISEFTCRLLQHMDEKGVDRVEVVLPPDLVDSPRGLWVDPEDFNPGYLARGQHLLPKTAPGPEWRHTQDYWREKDEIPRVDLDGPAFRYARCRLPMTT